MIPHGLAWGVHAPPAARARHRSSRARNHDPERQRLLEVFSGHGNSEEYRDAAARASDAGGAPVCPAPTPRATCPAAGRPARSCARAAATCPPRSARRASPRRGGSRSKPAPTPQRVLPDTRPEDWLDCDQCRDCFKPAPNAARRGSPRSTRSRSRNFDDRAPARPLRFRFGFVASSDNHSARAGHRLQAGIERAR